MAGTTRESANCTCGLVVFDVTNRMIGEALTCPWCGKKYRYAGNSTLTPFEEATASVLPPLMVFIEDKKEEGKFGAGPPVERIQPYSTSLKPQPEASPAATGAEGGDKPKKKAKRKPWPEIPGGPLCMVCFIVAFNGVILFLLYYFFPRQQDGSRLTPWGGIIPRCRVPWPELLAILAGHFCAFVAWAWHIYRLQLHLKTAAAEQPAAKKDSAPPTVRPPAGEKQERGPLP